MRGGIQVRQDQHHANQTRKVTGHLTLDTLLSTFDLTLPDNYDLRHSVLP